jgi:hypothetical protein
MHLKRRGYSDFVVIRRSDLVRIRVMNSPIGTVNRRFKKENLDKCRLLPQLDPVDKHDRFRYFLGVRWPDTALLQRTS